MAAPPLLKRHDRAGRRARQVPAAVIFRREESGDSPRISTITHSLIPNIIPPNFSQSRAQLPGDTGVVASRARSDRASDSSAPQPPGVGKGRAHEVPCTFNPQFSGPALAGPFFFCSLAAGAEGAEHV